MICAHCGTVLADAANFCTECGRAQALEIAASQKEERQAQVNGTGAPNWSSQPAMVPLVEGKVYKLGSGAYEATFEASVNRWQLEDVTNYQRNLLFEDDGSLVEARYDPNLIAYKAIGPSGFTVADIHDASDPSSFTIADFHHASMKSNATAYWFVNVTFITIVVLAAVSAILDISFITDGDLLELLQAGFAGNPIDEAWVTEIMDFRRTMIISLSDSIASALLVTYFITAISFLTWFYRAYKNLEFGGFPLKHKSWWTVVGFMIPILNLRRPFDMMEELSSASTTLSRGEELSTGRWLATSRLVTLWWGLFLTMSQSGIIQDRLFGEIDQFDEFLKSLWFSLFEDLLLIVTAIVTLLLVRQVHTVQQSMRVKYWAMEGSLAYTPQTRYS